MSYPARAEVLDINIWVRPANQAAELSVEVYNVKMLKVKVFLMKISIREHLQFFAIEPDNYLLNTDIFQRMLNGEATSLGEGKLWIQTC